MKYEIIKSKVDLEWNPDVVFFDFEIQEFWFMVGFRINPLTWYVDGSVVHGLNKEKKICPLCQKNVEKVQVCSVINQENTLKDLKRMLIEKNKIKLLLSNIELPM